MHALHTGTCKTNHNKYLNTAASRPDRLRDIADRFNLDQSAVLDNVLYARAYTSKILRLLIILRHTFFLISIKK